LIFNQNDLENDLINNEKIDIPFVLAYNGRDHYAPTKPIRNFEMAEVRKGNVYQAASILEYMMKRMVHEKTTDEEAHAWHALFDVVRVTSHVFRPADEAMARGYEGPSIQKVTLKNIYMCTKPKIDCIPDIVVHRYIKYHC
jgi:dienelactone hydrolase